MRETQRRILGAMLQMSNDDMEVESTVLDIALNAGYKNSGGAITDALELLEYHNKIVRVGDKKWVVTI